MSNESYARGFVKKAQECGVNPNDLIDFIKKSADQDAFDERVQDAMKDISDYVEKHPIESGALTGGLSSVASGAQAGRALGGSVGGSVGGVAGSALSPVGSAVGASAGSSGATQKFTDMVKRERADFQRIREQRKKVIEQHKKMQEQQRKMQDSCWEDVARNQRIMRAGGTNGIGRVVRNADGSITETRRPLR